MKLGRFLLIKFSELKATISTDLIYIRGVCYSWQQQSALQTVQARSHYFGNDNGNGNGKPFCQEWFELI